MPSKHRRRLLPPFRELYDQDLKTPVRVHVEALEAHQATVPRSLPPDVAGELLRPLFGDPHKPAKPPAPHGFVDTLLDTLEVTIDSFKPVWKSKLGRPTPPTRRCPTSLTG